MRVAVGKEFFEKKDCYFQQARLRRLTQAGADVRLCGGLGQGGAFHQKALILSSRVAWTGSADWTSASTKNRELVTRLVRPPVSVVAAAATQAADAGEAWHGQTNSQGRGPKNPKQPGQGTQEPQTAREGTQEPEQPGRGPNNPKQPGQGTQQP